MSLKLIGKYPKTISRILLFTLVIIAYHVFISLSFKVRPHILKPNDVLISEFEPLMGIIGQTYNKASFDEFDLLLEHNIYAYNPVSGKKTLVISDRNMKDKIHFVAEISPSREYAIVNFTNLSHSSVRDPDYSYSQLWNIKSGNLYKISDMKSGTVWVPTFSPDSQNLAFFQAGSIMLMNLPNKKITQLTGQLFKNQDVIYRLPLLVFKDNETLYFDTDKPVIKKINIKTQLSEEVANLISLNRIYYSDFDPSKSWIVIHDTPIKPDMSLLTTPYITPYGLQAYNLDTHELIDIIAPDHEKCVIGQKWSSSGKYLYYFRYKGDCEKSSDANTQSHKKYELNRYDFSIRQNTTLNMFALNDRIQRYGRLNLVDADDESITFEAIMTDGSEEYQFNPDVWRYYIQQTKLDKLYTDSSKYFDTIIREK